MWPWPDPSTTSSLLEHCEPNLRLYHFLWIMITVLVSKLWKGLLEVLGGVCWIGEAASIWGYPAHLPRGGPSLKFMVSPPSHVNRVFGPGLSAHREDSGYNTATASQVTSRWSSKGLLGWVSRCDPWDAHSPLQPARPSCWPCKFSHCFEPKTGMLVLCWRCVPSLSMRLQDLKNRCHLPECWHASGCVILHFSFSLPLDSVTMNT